jgi:3-deoxy-D-manno-octulosonic acid kinase
MAEPRGARDPAEPRIAETTRGVVLLSAERCEAADPAWFEPAHWRKRRAVVHETAGRGAVLVVEHRGEIWALRHYRRGGMVARIIEDHYLWLGIERTRAFREWRLLQRLHEAGLPVPRPVAARVARTGPVYTADIITSYLRDTRRLSAFLADDELPHDRWERIGRMVRSFHEHGVDHPDLTAHNILLDSSGAVFLVDFDNAAVKPAGRWQRAGMARLERSLRKVAMETGTEFHDDGWRLLERGYYRDDTPADDATAPTSDSRSSG